MMHTLPNYKHHVTNGASETKQQKQARLDLHTKRYSKRPLIDKHNEQRELARTTGEVWDE